MSKILDVITVLFQGDTTDLQRKKKEAEQITAEAIKDIESLKAHTDTANDSLDNTNKILRQTRELTDAIGEDISKWSSEAIDASTSLEETITADKIHRQQTKTESNLKATKRGALEVEEALKKVVKEFAAAALASFTVAEGVSRVKDVVGGTLDLSRTAKDLLLPVRYLDALGQAAKSAGGNIEDAQAAVKAFSQANHGITGSPLFDIIRANFKLLNEAPKSVQGLAANAYLQRIGVPESIIRAVKKPGFNQDVQDLLALNTNLDEAADKIQKLADAWAKFGTLIRASVIDVENLATGPLTRVIDSINRYITLTREKGLGNAIATGSAKLYSDVKASTLTTDTGAVKVASDVLNSFKALVPDLISEAQIGNKVYNSLIGRTDFSSLLTSFPAGGTAAKSVSVSIDTLNVNAPNAQDAEGIAYGFQAAIEKVFKSNASVILNYHDTPTLA